MTALSWSDLRAEVSERFGSFPTAADEHDILEAFRLSPTATRGALARVAARYADGKIFRPWTIWAREVQPRGDVVVDTTPDRDRQAARAEAFIRRVGHEFPNWRELDDELFGDRGMLRHWPDLRERMRSEWETTTARRRR